MPVSEFAPLSRTSKQMQMVAKPVEKKFRLSRFRTGVLSGRTACTVPHVSGRQRNDDTWFLGAGVFMGGHNGEVRRPGLEEGEPWVGLQVNGTRIVLGLENDIRRRG